MWRHTSSMSCACDWSNSRALTVSIPCSRALSLSPKPTRLHCQNVQVRDDGSLSGFDEIESSPDTTEAAGAILIAHLLELLITFIGESLTLNLVKDAWPDALSAKLTNQTNATQETL